ncbi:uncharacterized protein [Delphinus delphis]|uniref:uncharacterized protein n=1 Tax=Delphinus delphis TaxID=9728 RepID=UPI0028C4FB54|nr:uncharacterized protein LOC132427733 [Delphinus delphis]
MRGPAGRRDQEATTALALEEPRDLGRREPRGPGLLSPSSAFTHAKKGSGLGIIMTSADSVHLLTLEARGELSPPDRIHTQTSLTPDNQEQTPSRRRECRKAVSSAPSEFTLANGAPGPCPSTRYHGRRGCRSLASRETCDRVRAALPPGSGGFPASGCRPLAAVGGRYLPVPGRSPSGFRVLGSPPCRPATGRGRQREGGLDSGPVGGHSVNSKEPRVLSGREPRAREEAARRSTTFRDVMLTREGAGGPQSRDSPGTQSRSARSLLAFYLQKQKGEEVMKRINTLLLILATSEALHGKSEVTGILEEGHLAIRKFQRDVVTARHTVGAY